MHAFTIAGKDMRQRLRDRSFFMLGIVVPLALTFILSNLIPSEDSDFSTTLVVADLDGSELGAGVIGGIEESGFTVVTAIDRQQALNLIDAGDADSGFVIPQGFSAATQSFSPAEIEVLGNPAAQISTLISEAIAAGVAAEVEAVQLAVGASIGGNPLQAVDDVAQTPWPISIKEVAAGDRQLDFTTYMSIGMAIFFLFFTVQFGILSVLEEQRDGTMARLLAAPLSPGTLLLGKSLSSVLVGLLSMAVLVVMSTLLMGADWGNLVGVAILSLAGVISAMGIGALLGTLAKTADQAGNYAAIVAVTLGLLGGVFFPVAQASGALAAVSKISPHAWLLQGFGDNTGSGRMSDVLLAAGVVVLTGLVPGAIALMRRDRMGVTT